MCLFSYEWECCVWIVSVKESIRSVYLVSAVYESASSVRIQGFHERDIPKGGFISTHYLLVRCRDPIFHCSLGEYFYRVRGPIYNTPSRWDNEALFPIFESDSNVLLRNIISVVFRSIWGSRHFQIRTFEYSSENLKLRNFGLTTPAIPKLL